MQISTKFTIAVHILAATRFFEKDHKITSQFLASSIGSNPVIIRNIMTQLQEAGIIDVKRGPGGNHHHAFALGNHLSGYLQGS